MNTPEPAAEEKYLIAQEGRNNLWPLLLLAVDSCHAFPVSPVLASPHNCTCPVEAMELDEGLVQCLATIGEVRRA